MALPGFASTVNAYSLAVDAARKAPAKVICVARARRFRQT